MSTHNVYFKRELKKIKMFPMNFLNFSSENKNLCILHWQVFVMNNISV